MVLKHCPRLFVSVLFLLIASEPAHAAILFEGFSKLLSGSVHTGYIIQRFEVDKKTGHFTVTAFTKTGPLGGDITESVKAVATKGLEPISYSYTSTVGKDVKIIDATFKKGKMIAKVTKGPTTQVIEKQIEKGTFMSSFLVYLMLQSKDGIKKGTKYSYKAIAEEDPDISSGEAFVDSQDSYKGQTVFKILNTFKGTKFVSYVTPNGEVLMTKSPVQGVATEVVAKSEEAIGQFPFNPKSLKLLFGDVPRGTENAIAKAATATPMAASAIPNSATSSGTTTATPPPVDAKDEKWKTLNQPPTTTEDTPKKQGVPGGQGLILKGKDEK